MCVCVCVCVCVCALRAGMRAPRCNVAGATNFRVQKNLAVPEVLYANTHLEECRSCFARSFSSAGTVTGITAYTKVFLALASVLTPLTRSWIWQKHS